MARQTKYSRKTWTVVGAGAAAISSLALAVPLATSALAGDPPSSITGITVSGYPQPATPTVTVTGTGFPSAPPTGSKKVTHFSNCTPGETGRDYPEPGLWLLDASAPNGPWGLNSFQDGAYYPSTATRGDCGGVIISSWSSTKVVFTLGSGYQSQGPSLEAGDHVCVDLNGTTGCVTLS
jgi:hypothetical protein